MSLADEGRYRVDRVSRLDCHYAPTRWDFATTRAADIARHWAAAVRARPALFNGRVLMQTRGDLARDPDGAAVFRAAYTDVDFAAFLAWRDFGCPLRGFRNGFGMAALQAADGAYILGEMGAHTANAGRVYFPSGTPDLGDLNGSMVDIAGSIGRELAEETGLDPATLDFDPTLTVIQDDVMVGFLQRVRSSETAERLAARIRDWLASETRPELCDVHIVRTDADITPAMSPFVALYLRRSLREPQPG